MVAVLALTCLVLIFMTRTVAQSLTPSTYLTPVDRTRLETVFKSAQPYQSTDSIHYSVLGLKLLGATLPNDKDTCSKVKSLIGLDLESVFHATLASNALTNCKLTIVDASKKLLTDTITTSTKAIDIYHAFFALKGLTLPVDDKTVKASLLEALKTDDSPQSYGYAFHVASELTGDLTTFFDYIEDVVAQADEIDDRYLQFEGGLFTTSLILEGSYKLAAAAKKVPTINDNKVMKFLNYLLGRKHVHQLRSAYYLLSSIHTLAHNKFYHPIAVTLASPVAVSEKSPTVQVRVTSLLGENLGDLTVTAENARHLADDAVVVSKKPFTISKTDKSMYELGLLDVKPARGFYTIELSVQRNARVRLLGNTGAAVQVKVTTQVAVENVEIGVGDSDQTTAPRTTNLMYPNKAANILEADYHQKIILKFKLRDKTSGKLMTAHQAFIRMVNKATGQEIIFVAEADSTLVNLFDLDIGTKGKEFNHLSGEYSMELIIGDASIDNSFTWLVADVMLSFQDEAAPKAEGQSPYSKRPEIKHMFREDEKRPPFAVSTAFTILALVPLAILLALWVKIGVNISNFPGTVSAIGFHVCLAGVFLLYFLYWFHLNMFETLRYLGILSVPTFLFGNRLLSAIASKKK